MARGTVVDANLSKRQPTSGRCFHSLTRHDWNMNIIQLLIAAVAIVGVIVIVLLAIIPSLLDYPRGRDKDESDPPAPTPLKPDDHRNDSMDLAA
jgi:hypothetical protein